MTTIRVHGAHPYRRRPESLDRELPELRDPEELPDEDRPDGAGDEDGREKVGAGDDRCGGEETEPDRSLDREDEVARSFREPEDWRDVPWRAPDELRGVASRDPEDPRDVPRMMLGTVQLRPDDPVALSVDD